LGFVVRLYKIDSPIADWHSWRQADTASVSKTFVERGVNMLYPRYHDISSIQTGIFNPEGFRMVEFPVYNALHAVLYKSFGTFSLEVWGRMLTALISVLTGFFIYLLGKKHYSMKVGLFAAFFFLFLPFNIFFSRVILPDPIGVLFAVSALYFFDINILVSGALFSLALLQKPYFAFYLLPFAPFFLKKENLRKSITFALIALIPFFAWRAWIGRFPEGIPFWEWAFNGDRIRFHPAFWRWIFGERLGILILGVWGLVPFIFGVTKKLKDKFALYFILGMALYVTIVASANVRHDYYQILIIPAVSLCLAIGSAFLWKRSKIILAISIVVMFLIGWDRIKPFYQINHPELMEVGKVVDQTLPKDALIVAPYNGDTAFLYQTNRWGWPAVDTSIDKIIGQGADYYVSIDLHSEDTRNFEKMFKTIAKTDKYIILDLHKSL
jgi:hypothetical protein